jgi:hypothetical protein
MLATVKIAITAVLVLGTAFSASAATRLRAGQASQLSTSTGNKYGPYCTASGGPQCNTGCQATGAPCKEEHDGW